MMRIESDSPVARNIDYHDAIRKCEYFDASQLHIVRKTLSPGSETIIDLPYDGDVLIDYFIEYCGTARTVSRVARGGIHEIAMNPPEAKAISIKVLDEHNDPVPDARLLVVQRSRLADDEIMPPHIQVLFIPKGEQTLLIMQRSIIAAGADGRAGYVLSACDELFVSATSPRIVGRSDVLWSGRGLPEQSEFIIHAKRAPAGEKSLITLRGKPVANFDKFVVTDMEPSGSFMQVDFGYFRSDEHGLLDLNQLTPGHRYSILFVSSQGRFNRFFDYSPGIRIGF